jgi:initiation factor 1A
MREEEKEQEDIGDFEEIVDETKKNVPVDPNQPVSPGRLYKPRQGQFIGIVTERLGGNRMSVKSTDNKIRNSRVPGRFRRKFWLRPGDAVIVSPGQTTTAKQT